MKSLRLQYPDKPIQFNQSHKEHSIDHMKNSERIESDPAKTRDPSAVDRWTNEGGSPEKRLLFEKV